MKINPVLSDLFFNYPHPRMNEAWDNAHAEDRPLLSSEQYEAISEDAREFLENYGSILPACSVSELAESFMRRV